MKYRNIVKTTHSLTTAVTWAKELTEQTKRTYYADKYELTSDHNDRRNNGSIQNCFVYEIIEIESEIRKQNKGAGHERI